VGHRFDSDRRLANIYSSEAHFLWSGLIANQDRGTGNPFHEGRILDQERAIIGHAE
jgi:hypothetical protein